MKGALLLLVSLCLIDLYCCAMAPARLIAFNESYSVWMSAEDALRLESNSENFMDITDFQNPVIRNFKVDPMPTKLTRQALVNELNEYLEIDNLKATITRMSSFFTRYYNSQNGKDSSAWVLQQFKDYSAARDDIHIEPFAHTFMQPSVIARIEGSSGDKGATRIVVGGHQDSVGRSTNGQAPGADDDASGTSTVLEVFRVLAQSGYKPERTVEFHAYAGEEGGLLGSQAIAKAYSDLDIVVEAMLQFDMTMYGGNATDPIGIITDYVSPEASEFIRLLVKGYSTFSQVNTKCGYGCSDHASWNRYGYRSSFPFEGTFSRANPYIHSPSDLLSHLNLVRGLEFVKIGVGFVVELAGGDISKK